MAVYFEGSGDKTRRSEYLDNGQPVLTESLDLLPTYLESLRTMSPIFVIHGTENEPVDIHFGYFAPDKVHWPDGEEEEKD